MNQKNNIIHETLILNQIPFGICMVNHEFIIDFWNPIIENWSGMKADYVLGKNFLDTFEHLKQNKYKRRMMMLLQGGPPVIFSPQLHPHFIPCPLGDRGLRYLQTVISSVNDQEGRKHLIFTFEDMSQYIFQMNQISELKEKAVLEAENRKKIAETLEISEAKYREMAIRDYLTGVFNRHYFISRLDEELERNKRDKSQLSLIMLDIDYFKKINDYHGHGFGDFVLQELCKRIAKCIRKVDTICRYGGEEFIILLPNVQLKRAYEVAERIRIKVEKDLFRMDKISEKVTVSAGVASSKGLNFDRAELLNLVDTYLYKAKNNGRNRVWYESGHQ